MMPTPLSRALHRAPLFLGVLAACVSSAPGESAPSKSACPASFSSKALSSGQHKGFAVEGEPRSFHLLLPPGSSQEPRPLLVAFHGTTETGARFVQRAGLQQFAGAGFVVVAPDAVGHGALWPVWDALRLPTDERPNPDLAYFDQLVACVSERLPIDPERVFVAGHSAGGIFSNRVLQARSDTLAGGIVASGLFELTGQGRTDLSSMRVIVTWGGENDVYTGKTSDGTTIRGFSFAEQGALASRFYASAPRVDHLFCEGSDRGHAWLRDLNPGFIRALLGQGTSDLTDQAGAATCSAQPASLPQPGSRSTCAQSTLGEGPSFCEVAERCVLANVTVGPVMAPHLARIGIGSRDCATCVSRLSAGPTDPDAAVLSCLAQAKAPTPCPPGLAGALPVVEHLDQCCARQPGASICRDLCSGISAHDAAAAFLTACRRP